MGLSLALGIGVGLAAIGAVGAATASTVGAVASADQQKANAEAQAQQAAYNQRLANREAAAMEQEQAEAARRQRIEAEQLRARQLALLGKSGAALQSGSPLAVLGQTAMDQELAIQDAHRTGYRQVSQQREQAKMFGYEGAVARASAPSAALTGASIAGSWFGAAGQVGSSLMNYSVAKGSIGRTQAK